MKDENKPWYQKKAFLAERRKWYQKLEKSGFEDLEHTTWENGEAGHRFKAGGFRSAGDVQRRFGWDKVRYFELAAQRVWTMREEGCWPQEDILIMEMHSEGATKKEIWAKLGVSYGKIDRVIKEQRGKFRDYLGEYDEEE